MRIVLIGPAFDIAGASLNLLRMADILLDAGHTLCVSAMEREDGPLRQAYLDRGIRIVEAIRARDHDLAICNTIMTGVFIEKISARIPVIWWIRECTVGSYLIAEQPLLGEAFRHASRVVFQSGYIRDHIYGRELADVAADRVRIIPQGIPVPELFPRPARSQKHLVVVAGTLTRRKRPRDVFKAVQRLGRGDVELVSVGKTQKVDPIVPALARDDPEHFRMTGEIAREACFGWIAEADVLAHAASDESQPNVLIEAAYARTAIAASNLPVLEECGWVDGENCLLHEVGDVDGLSRNIARLLDDPALAAGLAAHASETVCARFAMPVFRRRLLDLIEETLAA